MRLFVALDIPQDVRDSLAALRARFEALCRGAHWVRIEGAHITLKFIGEVPAERGEEIRAALRAVHTEGALALRFAGLGFFPHERHPRVFWAGIEAGPALAELAAAVESALVPLGIPREKRDFRAHLTLARFDLAQRIEPLRQGAAEMATAEFGRGSLDAFHLYQSVLKPTGAEYTRLETYPLSRESVS